MVKRHETKIPPIEFPSTKHYNFKNMNDSLYIYINYNILINYKDIKIFIEN